MQIWATGLQLLGALVTAAGLIYAWNRVSRRIDQWRESVKSTLAGLRAQLVKQNKAEFGLSLETRLEFGSSVELDVKRPGTVEERLHRVENEIAALPSQNESAIEAAIDKRFAEFDALTKSFAVKDLYIAIAGIVLVVIGLALDFLSVL